jgi:hypothetical protein
MYGVEAQATGLGGLAAQAPRDLYFGGALGIASPDSGVVGTPPSGGVAMPYSAQGATLGPTSFGGGVVNASGTAVHTPVSQQHTSWSSVLDFHNSVAPWILIGILVLYGWLHASVRAKAGAGKRVGAGAEVVL